MKSGSGPGDRIVQIPLAAITINRFQHQFPRGNKGAVRISSLSFQYLRRPGCTAKLLCFQYSSSFDPHCLWKLSLCFQCVTKFLKGTKGALSDAQTQSRRIQSGKRQEDFILGHAIQECQRLYSLRLIETVRKTQSRSHLGNLQIRFGTAVNADAVTGLHVSFAPTRPSRRASERKMRAICCYRRGQPNIPNSPTNTLLLVPGAR